jgi:hypothetical protein
MKGETLHDGSGTLQDLARQYPRRVVSLPIQAIAVHRNGQPAREQPRRGRLLDISLCGVGLVLDGPTSPVPTTLMVVTADYGVAGLQIVAARVTRRGRLRVGGCFGGPADALLQSKALTPAFDSQTFRFLLPQAPALLESWAALGVLTPVVLDRVQVCPRCRALPTFRRGCPACGSTHVQSDRLLHHFACAYIGLLDEFETAKGLMCPKCQTPHLIVGSDYEALAGPYRCQDCEWSSTELEQVAECLACRLRFPSYQAHEQELRGYRAHRLDPLALLHAPRAAPQSPDCPPVDGRSPLCPE